MMIEKPIEIRWRDVDGMGHVNNAVFMTYAEEVRGELLTTTLGPDVLPLFVVVRFEIDFRKELRQSDEIAQMRCGVARIGRTSLTTREVVASPAGIHAESSTVMVVVDETSRRARPLDERERGALTPYMWSEGEVVEPTIVAGR
jgi:acyl-CoA thioester hydrolase